MSLKNPVTPPGTDPGTVRLITRRLYHYVITDLIYKIENTNFKLHVLPDLGKTYVMEGPTKVKFCGSRDLVYITELRASVYTMESTSNSVSQTLKPDQPQHNRLSTSLTAHHYLSPTFVSLRFRFGKEILDKSLQKEPVFFNFLNFSPKLRKSEIA